MSIENFKKQLTEIINQNSLENLCDMPDYMIADFLLDTFIHMSAAVKKRDAWYGFRPFAGNPMFLAPSSAETKEKE